ncbi:HpsJ family protein [Nostoc piscinale]|uniref:HpsJ-like protein, cyanoexosortase A-associated n=1 Tax=Nostoc piscinale TaxID=224012 RepID=UPI000B1A3542|nr:HpsJ family protein [Nostoc piscinale]
MAETNIRESNTSESNARETDIREFVELEFTKLSKLVGNIQPLLELVNLWRFLGYGMLLLAFLDLIDIFVPPSFMNPTWEFQTMGRLVNQVGIPLIGLLFVFSGKLAKRARWESGILALLSRLSLLVALLYLLLIPLGVVNTIRLYNTNLEQIKTGYEQRLSQANQVEEQLNKTSPTDIDNLIKRQGGSLNGRSPEDVKNQILSQLNQTKQQLKTQKETNQSSVTFNLLKNSVRWNIGALISAVLFILIWKETRWARKKSA